MPATPLPMVTSPPLSADEEKSLLAKAKQGDLGAQTRLIAAFQPLFAAHSKAASRKYGLDAEDLAQEAAIELLDAIQRFEPARGLRFSTFLTHRLKGRFTAESRTDQQSRVTSSWWTSNADWFKNDGRMIKTYARTSKAVCAYWPDAAIDYVKRLRRRNDRLIAKGLWLDSPPRRPADIARRLGISRSAVCQRQQKLIRELTSRFGNLLFSPYVRQRSLNSYWDYAIYESSDDLDD